MKAALALLCFAVMAVSAPARAAVWDLCARGIGQDTAAPFMQTLRVLLTLSGAVLDDNLVKPFAAQLIRSTLWAGKAEQVFVETYDESECAASFGRRALLSADVRESDVQQARAALGRGASELAGVAEVARRAAVSLDMSNAEDPLRRWLRVFYATNRRASGATATATAFGSERVDALSYGSVDVAVLHQAAMREVESPAVSRIDKATRLSDFEVGAVLLPMSLQAWRAELRQRAARFEQPGVLLFIHGFNVSFADAAQRSAQLAYDLAFPGPTVFFAWPSDATVVHFLQDGRDARNSRQAASTVLSELAGLLASGPVYVVAHSMGNRVLSEGLLQLLEDEPGKRRALREVVLAAPDIDQEDFRLNFAPHLLASGPRFTLYASKNDLALSSSALLQGGRRLGFGGDALYVQRGMDSVDASAVTKEFFSLNHSYFGDKTTVLADLFFLIRHRLGPDKRPNLRPLGRADGSAWAF